MERAIVTVERIQLMQIGRIGAASCNTPEIILVKVTDQHFVEIVSLSFTMCYKLRF